MKKLFSIILIFEKSVIWMLFSTTSDIGAYLIPFYRNDFIKYHHVKAFDEIVEKMPVLISNILAFIKRSNRSNRLSPFWSGNKRRRINRLLD